MMFPIFKAAKPLLKNRSSVEIHVSNFPVCPIAPSLVERGPSPHGSCVHNMHSGRRWAAYGSRIMGIVTCQDSPFCTVTSYIIFLCILHIFKAQNSGLSVKDSFSKQKAPNIAILLCFSPWHSLEVSEGTTRNQRLFTRRC